MICQGLPLCGGPLSLLSQYQVRQAVSGFIGPAAEYHLHRKTHILPYELAKCFAFCDLSVGYAMFFSRRWILCIRIRTPGTACLICCCSSSRNRYHLHMKSDSSLRCLTLTTNHRYSPPDLLLLVKPAQASPLPHIVSSRTIDALLPRTNSRNSPPDLFFLTHKSSKKQLSYGIIIPYIFRTFI